MTTISSDYRYWKFHPRWFVLKWGWTWIDSSTFHPILYQIIFMVNHENYCENLPVIPPISRSKPSSISPPPSQDCSTHAPTRGQLSTLVFSIFSKHFYRVPHFLLVFSSKRGGYSSAYLSVWDTHARNSHLQKESPFASGIQNLAFQTKADFFSILRYDCSAGFESSPVPYPCFPSLEYGT